MYNLVSQLTNISALSLISIMAVMELAESLECQNVALCVPKTANQIQPFVHDLLLVGFELIHPQAMQLKPSVKSNYVCLGMEL